MKKTICVVLISLMLVAVAFADEAYILCRPDDYVNVRMFPTTQSDVVGQLDCGDKVDTEWVTRRDRQGRKWILVEGFEGDAWVCSLYIQETPVDITSCTGYVASIGRLAVRRAPNGKIVKWLSNGSELRILAMSDEWALTTLGYIKVEYLDVVYDDVYGE